MAKLRFSCSGARWRACEREGLDIVEMKLNVIEAVVPFWLKTLSCKIL